MDVNSALSAQQAAGQKFLTQTSAATSQIAVEEGFSFFDFLDIINPLQHIPVVSSVYRAVTGDQMTSSVANVAGATIFGGPIGGGIALANEVVEAESGKDLKGHIKSAILGEDASSDKVALANAQDSYSKTEELTQQPKTRIRATTHDWMYRGTFMA